MYDKTWLKKNVLNIASVGRLDCSQCIPSSTLSAGEIHLVSLHDLEHVPGMKNSKNVTRGTKSCLTSCVLSAWISLIEIYPGVFSQTCQTLTSFSRSSWSTGFAFAPFRCAWATNSKVTSTQKGCQVSKWRNPLESWECWEVTRKLGTGMTVDVSSN